MSDTPLTDAQSRFPIASQDALWAVDVDFARGLERSITELNNRLIERTAAFMEQAAKDAQRIRDLEAQQQNWRLSSVCREKQARIEELEADAVVLRDAIEALLPFTDDYWDEGPRGEGWQSDKLVAAIALARKALSEPKADP